jgi:hypothetical protein
VAALVFIFVSLVNQFFVSSGTVGADRLGVLFIGNSYTYFKNIPSLVAGLSAAAKEKQPIEAEMIAVGGATLKKLWEDGAALKKIRQGDWDYVVLQEQSTLGSIKFVNNLPQVGEPQLFHEYARKFDAEIRKAGAKTILYLTWARQDNPAMQQPLTEAYTSIAKELNALVAPVGIAWETALKNNSQLSLHLQDKSHPSPTGSYLAACVIYSTIYGKSPEKLTGQISGVEVDRVGQVKSGNGQVELVNLSAPIAAQLQKVAWETIQIKSR